MLPFRAAPLDENKPIAAVELRREFKPSTTYTSAFFRVSSGNSCQPEKNPASSTPPATPIAAPQPAAKPAPVAAKPAAPASESLTLIRQLQENQVPFCDWPERLIWRYYIAIKTIKDHPKRIEVRDAIFERHRYWVERVARSYAKNNLPAGASVSSADDLVQDSLAAMTEAIENYDLAFGTTFPQFVNSYRIRGAMIDGLRRVQEYPRDVALLRRKFFGALMGLKNKLQRNVTIEELLEHRPDLKAIASNPLVFSRVFNQTEVRNKETGEVASVLLHVEDYRSSGEEAKHQQVIDRLDMILDCLEDEEVRCVIYNYYILEITQQLIAKGMGCKVLKVVELRTRGVQILRERLGRDFFREEA